MPVAAALGMSTADLRTELKGGKSLDDVAQQRGVSHADLVTAIKQGLPQQIRDSADADQVAEEISTRTGPPPRGPQGSGHPGGPARPGPVTNQGLDGSTLADLLGHGRLFDEKA